MQFPMCPCICIFWIDFMQVHIKCACFVSFSFSNLDPLTFLNAFDLEKRSGGLFYI